EPVTSGTFTDTTVLWKRRVSAGRADANPLSASHALEVTEGEELNRSVRDNARAARPGAPQHEAVASMRLHCHPRLASAS
uniref:Uncharacterized protein n=1 Tax=Tetraodon nigroviridis TaxID=99883 RepID=H3D8T6_TETNG